MRLNSDPYLAEWLVHRASTPQVRGSNPGLGKVDSAFHPFGGSIKEYLTPLQTVPPMTNQNRDTAFRTEATFMKASDHRKPDPCHPDAAHGC
ncbi:hypothetical protein TNCV_2894401 [Trichonephila clavipes]|nr:hypothetical protein TNCV_2894401 [Trichonephila clavipes]